MKFVGRVATRIINKVKRVNRVLHDATSKPPSRSRGSTRVPCEVLHCDKARCAKSPRRAVPPSQKMLESTQLPWVELPPPRQDCGDRDRELRGRAWLWCCPAKSSRATRTI